MFILIILTPKETSPNNSRFMNLDIALVMVRFFDLKWEVARMVYYWLCCNNWINPHMQQTSYGSFWILMGQWYPQLVFDLWGSLGIPGFRRLLSPQHRNLLPTWQTEKHGVVRQVTQIYIYGIQHKKQWCYWCFLWPNAHRYMAFTLHYHIMVFFSLAQMMVCVNGPPKAS